jgi:phytanoyl-CoA dioxygenase PhyH
MSGEPAAKVLSDAHAGAFYRDGYIHLADAVPRRLVERALAAINQSLGRGIDPAKVETYRSRSFCPELQTSPVITDLLYGGAAWDVAESLVGAKRLSRPGTGQIALSFPTEGRPDKLHPHLDGLYTPTNGVPRGEVLSFTALVGVMLSDVPAPASGNLVVWPGTHQLYEDYLRKRGPDSLLEGMPDVTLPEPVPVTGRAGDAVLCHYQLGHTAGPNTSPHIRYAVYFRLEHVQHGRQRWECLTDIWREWPGVRETRA